jgi:hypothetical protein
MIDEHEQSLKMTKSLENNRVFGGTVGLQLLQQPYFIDMDAINQMLGFNHP